MFSLLWYLLCFVIVLSILITFHELGHFLVARAFKVKVLKFSIGFGKSLLSWRDRQGTEYAISAIPLGGYVKMLDEWVEEVAPEDKPYSFRNKSVYARSLIVFAGPAFNFILAILAFTFMYWIGITSMKTIVGEVKPHTLASQADLRAGDQIIAVNQVPTQRWMDVLGLMIEGAGNPKGVELTVLPKTQQPAQKKIIPLQQWRFDANQESPFVSLGFEPIVPPVPPIIAKVVPNSAAARAGLMAQDKIVRIDQQPISDWYDMIRYYKQVPVKHGALIFEIERQGQRKKISVVPDWVKQNHTLVPQIGIESQLVEIPKAYLHTQHYGFIDSVVKATEKTWMVTKMTVVVFTKMIVGQMSWSSLSGPIGIAQGAGITANQGLTHFADFIATISIGLGVINLLPIPMLDGGHLLFYLIEWVRRKPLSAKFQWQAMQVGIVIMLALMALGIANDIKRLLT